MYEVKWEGWGHKHNTWENYDTIKHLKKEIKQC